MPDIESLHKGKYYWRYDKECFAEASQDLFQAEHWQKLDAVNGQETGRGTTWFVQHQSHSLVLRHYLRGGMMAKLSRDHYLFKNWQSCRSVAEFDILKHLSEQGFPVPKPAAAQVIKSGFHYQADLLTHRIPKAKDLLQVLKQAQSKDFYNQLGQLIAKFHNAGVFHADLNIQNILQDESGEFWLIDFDRAKMRSPNQKWQDNNLSRLKRSFIKEKERADIQWQEDDWSALIQGYRLLIS
jgi:3-deoxy-D-manno-octulosonic acid kinase